MTSQKYLPWKRSTAIQCVSICPQWPIFLLSSVESAFPMQDSNCVQYPSTRDSQVTMHAHIGCDAEDKSWHSTTLFIVFFIKKCLAALLHFWLSSLGSNSGICNNKIHLPLPPVTTGVAKSSRTEILRIITLSIKSTHYAELHFIIIIILY